MRRLFWIALGATAGVLVVRKITQAAESFTPDGAADRIAGGVHNLADAVRDFADEVKVGMAERDTQLRQALGITGDGTANGTPGEPDLAAVDELLDAPSAGGPLSSRPRTNPRGTH